ncbi:MAG: hypothetical protein AB7O57_16055 [Hyphomicrobiaceae bacterium]
MRHPIRLLALCALALGLIRAVLVYSLPFALVQSQPDLALWLNPNHPDALIGKAEQLRTKLLALKPVVPKEKGSTSQRPKADTIAKLPTAAEAPAVSPALDQQRTKLKTEIAAIAKRVIANDPLNAHAFRLLAEVTDETSLVRALMREAVKRSRRESIAVFWLLNDSYLQKDFAGVVQHADILLRTRPELSRLAVGYLGAIAAEPGGRKLIVARLVQGPPWRDQFFQLLPESVRLAQTPFDVMLALKAAGKTPSDADLAPYLTLLINKGVVELAYSAWIKFRSKEELARLGFLTNPSFEKDPSGLPFDWQITRGQNATAEFAPIRPGLSERALYVKFGVGRVTFPEVRQIVILAAGRYRLEGKLKGSVVAKRGLRWQFRCLYGPGKTLAETDMLLGQSDVWRSFSLDVTIPSGTECRAQVLRLFHDARSASEQLISGEIWFDDLRLIRAPE